MNIPAQLVIGSYIYRKLVEKEKEKFKLYKEYKNLNCAEWFGDNYFYDEEDLLEFWGVNSLNEINGSVYIRNFENLSRDEEKYWKSLSTDGFQVKIFWC